MDVVSGIGRHGGRLRQLGRCRTNVIWSPLLIAAVTYPATSGDFTDAGIWAAIAAAAFALALIIAAVIRAGWRFWTAADLDRALQVTLANPYLEPRPDKVSIGLTVGVSVRNGASIPISYLPTKFTVKVEAGAVP